jgi:tRNA pseudouridine32 synthase/23S rRNA pseudouridine746 synthase/23S rRNA pseudouridine1911/1915/1917 synthase
MIEVLYRSADLLAINKPSGISLLADRSGAECLWNALREQLSATNEEPFAVHRIDKGTSGVLLVALTRARQTELTRAFTQHAVRKFYVARVVGALDLAGRTGTIDLPLMKGRKSRYRVAGPRERITQRGVRWSLDRASDEGHASTTRLRRLAGDGTHTLLALQGLTGRTHQLRVHLAWVGFPIAGDHLYGRPMAPEQRWPRLALHCHRIVVDGITITAPTPQSITASVAPRHPRARGGKTRRGNAGMSSERK